MLALPTLLAMAAYLPPLVWGQSSSSSSSSVSRSAPLTATSSATSSSASASASSAIPPRILFDRIDTLVACDQAEISWEVFGIRGDLYSVALYVVDSDYTPLSSSAAATTSVSPRSVAPSSTSTSVAARVTTSASSPGVASRSSSSAEPATSLVGRALRPRQSAASTNLTLTTDQVADEPYTFTVAIPAGSYYVIAELDDPLGTTAQSNLFSVIERDNTSCLAGGGGSSTSSTRTSITGGIMQTPGAGSSDSSTSSGPSGGAIAGIVIGVLGGLAILAFLAFFCIRRRRRAAGRSFATREMGERGADDRFAALPSASSQDGQYVPGAVPVVAGERRDSDTDEKDVEAANSHDEHYTTLDRGSGQQPFPGTISGERETMTSPELDPPPALGDRRRQSGPPTTHTLVPKTSMQGIIGKASATSSHESSVNHSRSSSAGGTPSSGSGASPPVAGVGATSTPAKDGITRSASTKRKPVPSMGPELRGEMQREKERKMSESSGQRKPSVTAGSGAEVRRSYSLVPDPLPPQSHS